MNMRNTASALAVAFALTCGVAPLSLAAESTPQTPAKKAAPAKTESKKAAAGKKGKAVEESPEVVKQKLDVVGKKLVQDAAKNVTPSVHAKAVTPEGKEFVARYVEVDVASMTTEVRPASGPGGKFIGVIKYMENQYECRGTSKVEALKAPCSMVRSRRMNELIRYDGKWTF